jgi:tRNA dimethylallyltransferase
MTDSAENKPVIPILTGPTGSGKSAVINCLLEKFPDINIISADSRQIYRQLDIGTDKPSKNELAGHHYHLIDIRDPGERYTAFDFADDAKKIIGELLCQGKLPLISGGTGLYIRSLVEGIAEIPDDDFSIRDRLENEAIEKGPQFLYERLQTIDPDEALKIHPNNIRRVIRAIEIYELTGNPKSKMMGKDGEKKENGLFDIVVLKPSREELYAAINARVEMMMKNGLLEETEKIYRSELKEKVDLVNVIGYSELFQYLNDEITLDSAINLIKQNTRRFAKRQITWFRGMKNIKLLNSQELALGYLLKYYPRAN